MKKTLVFLCTGNSCRSQIAEGFGKKYLSDKWDVYSAGIEAHGINPKAVQTMKEVGVDISNHTSDIIDMELVNKADLVVTLCGNALDSCPTIPKGVKHEHWGFDDPAKQSDEVFKRVRDEIEAKIISFSKEEAE
jgi:arsenate reductase